jgi:hypothetical protein
MRLQDGLDLGKGPRGFAAASNAVMAVMPLFNSRVWQGSYQSVHAHSITIAGSF